MNKRQQKKYIIVLLKDPFSYYEAEGYLCHRLKELIKYSNDINSWGGQVALIRKSKYNKVIDKLLTKLVIDTLDWDKPRWRLWTASAYKHSEKVPIYFDEGDA